MGNEREFLCTIPKSPGLWPARVRECEALMRFFGGASATTANRGSMSRRRRCAHQEIFKERGGWEYSAWYWALRKLPETLVKK